MLEKLREKLSRIRDKLLDPFDTEGIERELEEFLAMLRKASPEERKAVKEEFEEVKKLISRNLSIIEGYLEPAVKRGGLFSRRV